MEKMPETERLIIKELTYEDFDNLSEMLKDIEVMYAWEHSFSDDEIKKWIDNNIKSYREDKTGYFFNPKDFMDLSNKIKKVLNTNFDKNFICNFAKENFTLASMVEKNLEVYNSLVKKD